MKKELAKQCIETVTAIGGFIALKDAIQSLDGVKSLSDDLEKLTNLAYNVLHEKEPQINLYVDDKAVNKQFFDELIAEREMLKTSYELLANRNLKRAWFAMVEMSGGGIASNGNSNDAREQAFWHINKAIQLLGPTTNSDLKRQASVIEYMINDVYRLFEVESEIVDAPGTEYDKSTIRVFENTKYQLRVWDRFFRKASLKEKSTSITTMILPIHEIFDKIK